ncbi:hypothetical protein BST81_25390 [Leptolyngbya sp. 'hensonii']|uniref:hypothetical protein n=1 Tax=Leptolyngbya sp. 'hensonii' TaxID=1922337 RepID=UPI00094FAFF3|nr:hypothetical protein [Leptolyngbya sp. 'hensonii']OLP15612.1 hypothetical protein BST81_25390 [Leptolyngbya sp. 'hensonii']
MQIGDLFQTPKGSFYRLDNLTEDDQAVFFHLGAKVTLPPIPRTVAENRLRNLSILAWEKGFIDLEVELLSQFQDQEAA